MLTNVIFFFMILATVSALLWSGIEVFRDREDPLADRLQELRSHAMANAGRPTRTRGGGLLNNILYLISLFPGGERWLGDTENELAHAGIRKRRALAVYSLFQLAFLFTLVGSALYAERDGDAAAKLGLITAAVILGWLLPQQVLHRLVKSYRRKLQDGLPDTVDLLGIVLGTGLALDQAMLRVAEEMRYLYPELADEFSTVVMQVKAGQERAKAFQQLVRRTGVEDIKALATMILQSERFGTSLAQALKVYADSLRNKRRLRAEAAVAKAGIKMLFPIVLFVLPALFVVTLVPGILSVLHDLKQGFGPPR